ncbi:MAG: conjugal transfer protein TraX [Clostridia bacterium]|nr:conjugal transfer protein TraX [Clostridia bacterium]
MKQAIDEPYRCFNRDVVKYIAMFTMLLNHIATIFLQSGTWLCEIFLAIGYFTAVVMIYFLVEGFYHTHSKKAYISRLFLFAVISEIPYCLAFTEKGIITFCGLNMLFTLCLCFGWIWITDTVKSKKLKVCLALGIILLSVLCSWAILAPIYTGLFVWARNSDKKTKIAFGIAVLLFGIINLLGGIGRFPLTTNILYAVLAVIGIGLAGICIVFLYNGKRMKTGRTFSKWFFYTFYPAHLLILGIIRIAMQMH